MDRLDAGEFDAVAGDLAPEARAAIDAAALEAAWTSLPQQLGEAAGRAAPALAQRGEHRVVTIPLRYARGTIDAVVAFDAQDRIAGLRFAPRTPDPAPAALPPGATERALTVGEGALALPGTLTLPPPDPARPGPVPAVVLVHGSGPHDRDQTLGPNKPFRDIAHGLAARGVAVLRYDKRSLAHPQAFAGESWTVDDEATNDAVAAIAALRAQPGVDPARVFVLGHSLGGLLAPRIARRAGAAGAVLLAAPSRRLLDVLLEQVQRAPTLGGLPPRTRPGGLEALREGVARLRDGGATPEGERLLGLPDAYWRSVDAIEPAAEARALGAPVLVLHGGRDVQVGDADWAGWRSALDDAPGATLKRYPALSHLGIAGVGPGSLADYQTPGRVDDGLLDDVAAWIHGRAP
nr:alpha/beta fold hydrolase [Luteimonas sp. Y-2-2-4F]